MDEYAYQVKRANILTSKGFRRFHRRSTKGCLLNRITYYILPIERKTNATNVCFNSQEMIFSVEVWKGAYPRSTSLSVNSTGFLVHDDVVGDSNKKRGFFSNTALAFGRSKNHPVLVRGLLLSKGFLLLMAISISS